MLLNFVLLTKETAAKHQSVKGDEYNAHIGAIEDIFTGLLRILLVLELRQSGTSDPRDPGGLDRNQGCCGVPGEQYVIGDANAAVDGQMAGG